MQLLIAWGSRTVVVRQATRQHWPMLLASPAGIDDRSVQASPARRLRTLHVTKRHFGSGLVCRYAKHYRRPPKSRLGRKTGSAKAGLQLCCTWLVRNTPAQRRSIANGAICRRVAGWQQIKQRPRQAAYSK